MTSNYSSRRPSNEVCNPSTSSNQTSLGFGSWRTPNAARPTLVIIEAGTQPTAGSGAQIEVAVDESGGTTEDYDLTVSGSIANIGVGVNQPGTISFIVPAGGSYQVKNTLDPATANTIHDIREWVL